MRLRKPLLDAKIVNFSRVFRYGGSAQLAKYSDTPRLYELAKYSDSAALVFG